MAPNNWHIKLTGSISCNLTWCKICLSSQLQKQWVCSCLTIGTPRSNCLGQFLTIKILQRLGVAQAVVTERWPLKEIKTPKNQLFFVKIFNYNKKIIYIYILFLFFYEKCWFSGVFSSIHGQRSVTTAWATPSPWSITFSNSDHTQIPHETTNYD